MITTEELDQILKELPYAAGGWAAETIRKLVEELKNLKEHSPPVSDLVKELRELSSPYIQEWEARKAAFIFEEPVFKNSVETLAFALCKAADALEKLSCEALSPPGPGAALLERLQKAEREVETLNSDIVYAADRWTKAEQERDELRAKLAEADEHHVRLRAWTERLEKAGMNVPMPDKNPCRALAEQVETLTKARDTWKAVALERQSIKADFAKAEARVKALREALERIAKDSECDHVKLRCRDDHDRSVCPVIAARAALAEDNRKHEEERASFAEQVETLTKERDDLLDKLDSAVESQTYWEGAADNAEARVAKLRKALDRITMAPHIAVAMATGALAEDDKHE